jgi:hypothetical protein
MLNGGFFMTMIGGFNRADYNHVFLRQACLLVGRRVMLGFQ